MSSNLSEDHEGIIELPDGPRGRRQLSPRRWGSTIRSSTSRSRPTAPIAWACAASPATSPPRDWASSSRSDATPVAGQVRLPDRGSPGRPRRQGLPAVPRPAHPRRQQRAEPALAAGPAQGDRAPADLGAGRHHQFPDLRSRPAARTCSMPTSSQGDLAVRGARKGEKLAALNGSVYALDAEMTVIADAERRAQPGRRHRRRAHRAAPRRRVNVYIEAALFDPRAHRRHRPQAQSAKRRALSLRARPRSRIHPARRRDRDAADPRAVRRRGVAKSASPGAVPDWRRSLRFRPDRTRSLGGLELPAAEQRRILEDLGCAVTEERRSCLGRAALLARRHRGRGRPGRGGAAHPRLRAHPGGAACRAKTALPKPALDAGAAPRGLRAAQSLAARGLVEAVTFSFMSAEAGGAVRRRRRKA